MSTPGQISVQLHRPHARRQPGGAPVLRLAYFLINNRDGLSVSPTGAEYVLKCRAAQYDVAKYQCVEPDTWYDVEMTYDWGGLGDDHNSLWVDVVLKGEDGSRNRLRHDFKRNPLSNVELYSYSPGVVRYTAIAIW